MYVKSRFDAPWKSTSFLICPAIASKIAGWLAERNLTNSKVVNAIYIALLNGDITIDDVSVDNKRMVGYLGGSLDSMLNIRVRDKQGNLIIENNNLNEEGE